MKESLQAGLLFEYKYLVPENKTVPYLYPEANEFQLMPSVFATGYMIGLIEWTCMQLINPHLDWPTEQTVGTDVKLSHTAATPPGMIVTVKVKLEQVDGRKLIFSVLADDGVDIISQGTHERFIIDTKRFNDKVAKKSPTSLG